MIFLQSLLTIALLLICSLAPGLFFVRYLRWRPLETLCASVALSFFLLYLAAFVIYGLGVAPGWSNVPTVFSVIAAVICQNDLRRLWKHRETRATILAFLALFSWLLLFLLLARNYAGGRWFGDWYEHYERAVFFTNHEPLDKTFFGDYILPARPPMMNLLAALLFWQVSPQFELCQIVFAYLNALVFLPCSLIAPSLVAKTRNPAWLIAGFLALNPMFLQNCTYTWTKLFAAFYGLTALGLYLSAWRKNDSPRMIAAFACLSTAMLVHYSAAPVVVFLGGHYLLVLFRRRPRRWRELGISAVVGIAIFMTWLGWSLYAYGWKQTLGSNTTVTGAQEYSLLGNLKKIVENHFVTMVPFPLRGPYTIDPTYDPKVPPRGLAFLRDWCFCIYQTSFPAMLGLGGLIVVTWLLVKLCIRPPQDRWRHRYVFWIGFVITVTILGIALVGSVEFFGIAHICLQPVVLVGLTFAAVGLPHVPPVVRGIALLGLLVDATLGILLHFHLLHGDFEMTVVRDQPVPRAHIEMGILALRNGWVKFIYKVTFLGDHAGDAAGALQVLAALGVIAICFGLWHLAAYNNRQTRLSDAHDGIPSTDLGEGTAMIFGQTALTIVFLLIGSLGPGLFFVRYLRWRPLETLCASVALSFLLLYFAALIIYALELPSAWAYLPATASALALLVCWRDVRRLWRHHATRAAILAFLALFFWLLLFLLLIRNYSGGRWWGDWYEHYERAQFFSEHKPADTTFLGPLKYPLPARPPLMNLLTALLFWQVSPAFELFQVVFAYLNALPILPCLLIAPLLVARTRNRAWLIAGFLALCPMFIQNGTYTWTKAFAAFYDLTALALYLAAWRRHDSPRMVAAFACLATAMLVHYSAVTFVLFLGGHYLFVLFRRRTAKWRELFASAAISMAIFMTWLGWSLYAYGPKITFGSNTTVTSSQQFTFTGNLQKIAENTFNTLVPFPLRGAFEEDPGYQQRQPPQGLAYWRDWFFCIYQTTFPAMLGWGGLVLIVYLLARMVLHPPADRRQHRYGSWFSLIVIVTFLSIAVHGEYDYFGVAHICLQPIVLLGLTFAAVGLPHVPIAVRAVALAGLLVDAALGILLHIHLLRNVFDFVADIGPPRPTINAEMGQLAASNGSVKFQMALTFLGDHAVAVAGILEWLLALATIAIIVGLWFLAKQNPPAILAVKKSPNAAAKSPRRRRRR